MQNKELLTIEFRYHDSPKSEHDSDYRCRTVTVGIFDTIEDAIKVGNETLNTLSKTFEVRSDDRFELHHLFGKPRRLVTNCCYPTNGIQYFAKIEQLKFDNLDEMVTETFSAYERYKQTK